MPETTKNAKNKKISDIIFIAISIILIIFVIFTTKFWISLSVVDGDSMNNTLVDGDILLTDNLKTPSRFDIVVFKHSESEDYIKRIIAIPGDVIYNDEHGNVWLQKSGEDKAEVLIEPYLEEGLKTKIQFYCELKEGEYFVMGDNRGNSQDSRIFGAINKEQITGIVTEFWVNKKDLTTKIFSFRR